MDESPAVDGDTLADTSGRGNDATLNSDNVGVDKSTTGKYGGAIQLDGTDDYISVPDSTDFDFGTGGFTITFWFKKVGENRADIFVWKNASGTDELNTILEADETMDVYIHINGTGAFVVTNGSPFSIDEWHHGAVVRDDAGDIVTYIDGSPDGSGSSTKDIDNIDAGTPIYIGANHDGSWNPTFELEGLVDEVLMFNRELSAGEIAALAGL